MKRWTRWEDWVALAAGVVTLLTPLWSDPGGNGRTAMLVLGVVLALTALWSLYDPGAIASEYSHAVLGVLLFVIPWVFDFTDETVAAYTCWIAGVVAVAAGLLAVREHMRGHGQLAH
jgi:hypothetical protein